MAQLVEINQVGKREDLRDFISLIDMKDKPLLAMIPKLPDQKNMLVSWQADLYATPITSGVADGVDVDSYENAATNRALIQNYGQKFRRTAMVGDLAENVSNVAGASAGELARSIDKKLEEIARDIEATFCSDNSAQAEADASTPYKTRGLGIWSGGTFSGVDGTQVPSNFRPPSASRSVQASTGYVESHLTDVLRSLYLYYGKRGDIHALIGTKIKARITGFTATSVANLGATASITSLRQYTTQLQNPTTIINNVMYYAGDFNDVQLHPSLLLNVDTTAAVSAICGDQARAYFFPLEALGMCYNRAPRVMKLVDQGGGPRALVDAIACLVVKNPLALGSNKPTAERS